MGMVLDVGVGGFVWAVDVGVGGFLWSLMIGFIDVGRVE